MLKRYYTKEAIEERIRELRNLRELILNREAELVLLHSSAVDNGVVDEKGRPVSFGEKAKLNPKKYPAKSRIDLAGIFGADTKIAEVEKGKSG